MELITIEINSFIHGKHIDDFIKLRTNSRDYLINKHKLQLISNIYKNQNHDIMILDNPCTRCNELFVKLLSRETLKLKFHELILLYQLCIKIEVINPVLNHLKHLIIKYMRTIDLSQCCCNVNLHNLMMVFKTESRVDNKIENRHKFIHHSKNKNFFLLVYTQFGPHFSRIINNKKRVNKKLEEETKLYFDEKNKGFYNFVNTIMKKKRDNICQKIEEGYNLVELCPNIKLTSSRYIVCKSNERHILETNSAILIQKNIKKYLSKKKFFLSYQEIIEKRIHKYSTLIQSNYRRYRIQRAFKYNFIIFKILTDRNKSSLILTRLIKNYYHSVNEKSKLIIENILSERIRSITTIQTNIKRYLIQKDLRNIIKNGLTCYKLDYPFKAKGVKIKIFVNLYDRSIQKIYDFTFCRIRKIFVLYINPSELNSGKYRVLLVVDNIVTCDGRFPHIEFSDGHYYNIIDFKLDNDRLQTSDTEDRTKIYNEASEKSKYTISEGSDTCEYFRQSIDSPIDRNLISNLKNKAALSHFESLKRSIEEENYNFDL